MKQLLDFLPLVIFFCFYKWYDIFVATKALIIATALALLIGWLLWRKLEKMTLVTFVLVAVFGTLTIKFHNPEFIKWKVTVIYSLFALALIFSQLWMKQPLIQRMLGKELQLADATWKRMNIAWSVFFLACGVINLYVAFRMSEDAWMNFKVFGLSGLTLVFTLLSGLYIWRHMPQQEK